MAKTASVLHICSWNERISPRCNVVLLLAEWYYLNGRGEPRHSGGDVPKYLLFISAVEYLVF